MKLAIAGAGYIAAIHAQAIQNCGGQVTAVVEKYSEKSAAFAVRYDVNRQYTGVEDLLRAGDVDGLVVCTPNFLHASQALLALGAGLPVMVEKPMAMNALEAEAMAAASRESGAPLMVAHCWRFDEEVLWLRAQLARVGRIIRTKGYGVHTNWGPSGWFTQKALAGGGAMADMGIHAVDTTRFLLGDPKPVSVYAKIGTYYGNYDVDDTGVILINWEGGASSYIESGWWQPHCDGPEAAVQIYGQHGFASLFPTLLEMPDAKEQRVETIRSGFAFPRGEHAPQRMYDAQMACFMDSIRNRATPVPGGEEGLVNMRIVDAAYESSRTGRVVEMLPS